MNVLNTALTGLSAPPAPAEAAAKQADQVADDDRKADRQQEDFDRLIQKEIERKKAIADATPLPHALMPWQPVHNPYQPTPEEEAAGIEAASAVQKADKAAARAFASALSATRPVIAPAPMPADAKRPAGGQDLEPAIAPAPKVEPAGDAPAPVHVVVEAGLPPVQPLDPNGEPKQVSLANFPQLVAGTARKLEKDGQAITQLDFEIHPPHVGPVAMTVSLQERIVSVQLVVPTALAKQQLEGQTSSIASILQSQNLTPGQIRIVAAPSGRAGAGNASQKGDSQQAGFGLLGGGRRRSGDKDDLKGTSV